MANKVCTVLVIALAMFGTGALAKPGYAAGYAVDYYVSVIMKSVIELTVIWNNGRLHVNLLFERTLISDIKILKHFDFNFM